MGIHGTVSRSEIWYFFVVNFTWIYIMQNMVWGMAAGKKLIWGENEKEERITE